jgi:hypothetical protein
MKRLCGEIDRSGNYKGHIALSLSVEFHQQPSMGERPTSISARLTSTTSTFSLPACSECSSSTPICAGALLGVGSESNHLEPSPAACVAIVGGLVDKRRLDSRLGQDKTTRRLGWLGRHTCLELQY